MKFTTRLGKYSLGNHLAISLRLKMPETIFKIWIQNSAVNALPINRVASRPRPAWLCPSIRFPFPEFTCQLFKGSGGLVQIDQPLDTDHDQADQDRHDDQHSQELA